MSRFKDEWFCTLKDDEPEIIKPGIVIYGIDIVNDDLKIVEELEE